MKKTPTTCLGKSLKPLEQMGHKSPKLQSVVNVNGNWVDLARVEVLDVSEGLFGEDRVTFRFEGEILERTVQLRGM